MKSIYQRHIHTPILAAALFTISIIWSQSKCVAEWMDKENMPYMHNRILFTLLKEWNSFIVTTCLKAEDIMLSEVRQAEKDKYCTTLLCGI
jgi:hypothetical protein